AGPARARVRCSGWWITRRLTGISRSVALSMRASLVSLRLHHPGWRLVLLAEHELARRRPAAGVELTYVYARAHRSSALVAPVPSNRVPPGRAESIEQSAY